MKQWKTKKEQIFYYDLIRTFTIMNVIICHIDHFFAPFTTPAQIICEIAFKDVGMVGVPIFLIISGALL